MGDWQPIATAPWQTIIEVRNRTMAEAGDTVLATRGYQTDVGVHPDDTFCTSVFTPDASGMHCLGFPAGKLVCPTEWRVVQADCDRDARLPDLPPLSGARPMNIADVLERAADLIEPEGAWTTEADARNRFGDETGIFDPEAVCFCIAGAIWRVAPELERAAAMHFLERFLEAEELPQWNDADERTQAEVVAKLREAAAKAREQEQSSAEPEALPELCDRLVASGFGGAA